MLRYRLHATASRVCLSKPLIEIAIAIKRLKVYSQHHRTQQERAAEEWLASASACITGLTLCSAFLFLLHNEWRSPGSCMQDYSPTFNPLQCVCRTSLENHFPGELRFIFRFRPIFRFQLSLCPKVQPPFVEVRLPLAHLLEAKNHREGSNALKLSCTFAAPAPSVNAQDFI